MQADLLRSEQLKICSDLRGTKLANHPIQHLRELRVREGRLGTTGNTDEKLAPALNAKVEAQVLSEIRDTPRYAAAVGHMTTLTLQHVVAHGVRIRWRSRPQEYEHRTQPNQRDECANGTSVVQWSGPSATPMTIDTVEL